MANVVKDMKNLDEIFMKMALEEGNMVSRTLDF